MKQCCGECRWWDKSHAGPIRSDSEHVWARCLWPIRVVVPFWIKMPSSQKTRQTHGTTCPTFAQREDKP